MCDIAFFIEGSIFMTFGRSVSKRRVLGCCGILIVIATACALVHHALFERNLTYSLVFGKRFHGATFTDGLAQYHQVDHYEFTDCKFTSALFYACDIVNSRFDGSVWSPNSNSITVGCKFINTSFKRAILMRQSFQDCRFENVDFDGADLSGSNFYGCQFDACRFDHCTLARVVFAQSFYGPGTRFPVNFDLRKQDGLGANPVELEPNTVGHERH